MIEDAPNFIPHPDDSPQWQLWRQDDHGNKFFIDSYNTAGEAEEIRGEFEKRGHKQTYWIQGPPDDDRELGTDS